MSDLSLNPYAPFDDEDDAPRPEEAAPVATRRLSLAVRIVRALVLTGLVSSVGGAVGLYLWLGELGVFDPADERLAILLEKQPEDNSLVFDRRGRKIGEFFNTYHVYVPFADLPQDLVNAIIAIEDRNFWTHKGFDPKGMLRAAWTYVKGQGYSQGASTITQQVVRNFLLPREKSIQRKIQEIAFAIKLEQKMPKKRILEIYANSLFLGNGSYGVGAAAYRYFGKPAKKLETHEAALIAGLFQSPSRYNPARFPKRAKRRQIQVIKAMYYAKMISFAKAKELIAKKLEYKDYQPVNMRVAPYFVDYVREQAERLLTGVSSSVKNAGLRIYTTLDTELQKMAEQAFVESSDVFATAEKRTAPLRGRKRAKHERLEATVEGAMLAVDPRNGHVLAMIGGRDYRKRSQYNRTVQAYRSPGSAFKPIVFSLALESGWKWSDVIFVSPVNVNSYRPRTPTEDYLTETTLLRAFYRSMNTPTIELGEKLGLLPVIEHAKKLGIRSPLKEEFGTMLGSSDVTMMDMARVYSTFANYGVRVEPIAITRIESRNGEVLYRAPKPEERSERVLTPQVAYLMIQGMRAVLQMGTGYRSARLASKAAGKTGTANNSTDNWFCGFSPNLVAITWVGTDEHVSIHGNETGSSLALPIWDRFMTKVFETRDAPPWERPDGVVTALVDSRYGHRSPTGVRMYFLRGKEPAADESAALEALSRMSQKPGSYRDIFAH